MAYLQENELYTVDDLAQRLNGIETKSADLRERMKKAETRLKNIAKIREARQTMEQLHEIYATYARTFFRKAKTQYWEDHKEDLQRYSKASGYLMKVNGNLEIDTASLKAESKRLTVTRQKWSTELETMKPDLEQLRNVKRWVDRALEDEVPKHLSFKEQMEIAARNANAHNQKIKQSQSHIPNEKRTTPDSLN